MEKVKLLIMKLVNIMMEIGIKMLNMVKGYNFLMENKGM